MHSSFSLSLNSYTNKAYSKTAYSKTAYSKTASAGVVPDPVQVYLIGHSPDGGILLMLFMSSEAT